MISVLISMHQIQDESIFGQFCYIQEFPKIALIFKSDLNLPTSVSLSPKAPSCKPTQTAYTIPSSNPSCNQRRPPHPRQTLSSSSSSRASSTRTSSPILSSNSTQPAFFHPPKRTSYHWSRPLLPTPNRRAPTIIPALTTTPATRRVQSLTIKPSSQSCMLII